MGRLPYKYDYHLDYRYLKQVRLLRNLTLKDMEKHMGVHDSVISRLENQQLEWTPTYSNRFKDACKKLRISNNEVISIKNVLSLREQRGIK